MSRKYFFRTAANDFSKGIIEASQQQYFPPEAISNHLKLRSLESYDLVVS